MMQYDSMHVTQMLFNIFMLLGLFQLKHFLADFPLQGKYMLGKFNEKGWVAPLMAHSAVHGCFTFLIAVCFTSVYMAAFLSLLDFVAHFVIDRLKVCASRGLGVQVPRFWHLIGIDQMFHHLTHYFIILIIIVKA